MSSKAQIVSTIGPASSDVNIIFDMISHQMDVARLNMAWCDLKTHAEHIKVIRDAEIKVGRKVLILMDLPGPRIQNVGSHTYDSSSISAITEEDRECIRFGVEQKVDYIAVSFVGDAQDIVLCREIIAKNGGTQPVVAKIERKKALENLESIIKVADAVMVARGDLGEEIPLEQVPFAQATIIEKAKMIGKPVIVATQMMLTMTEHNIPTRAEVTDVANAILQGADAVMLSEETASGKYPVESVAMMEKIVLEAEKHLSGEDSMHHL